MQVNDPCSDARAGVKFARGLCEWYPPCGNNFVALSLAALQPLVVVVVRPRPMAATKDKSSFRAGE